ncbi:methyltransferase [Lithospermum erythrorhizon]|uniref:Methyltransferase n=1 Tax=Lithospermum erythrorhizon TaxID=34254 RepID=A0AAV3P0R6_LITER
MWGVNVQPYIGLLLPGDRIMGLDTPSALQGGPHNNHIAALAIALKQVATQEYMVYMNQVKRNAKALASALLNRNSRLVTGGTDTHLLLWDLRPLALTGKNFEKVCELCHITVNKTTLFDDNGTITPGGVRIGTPAMTTTAAKITSSLQREYGKAFVKGFDNKKDILELGLLVESFASQFAMPGFDI